MATILNPAGTSRALCWLPFFHCRTARIMGTSGKPCRCLSSTSDVREPPHQSGRPPLPGQYSWMAVTPVGDEPGHGLSLFRKPYGRLPQSNSGRLVAFAAPTGRIGSIVVISETSTRLFSQKERRGKIRRFFLPVPLMQGRQITIPLSFHPFSSHMVTGK